MKFCLRSRVRFYVQLWVLRPYESWLKKTAVSVQKQSFHHSPYQRFIFLQAKYTFEVRWYDPSWSWWLCAWCLVLNRNISLQLLGKKLQSIANISFGLKIRWFFFFFFSCHREWWAIESYVEKSYCFRICCKLKSVTNRTMNHTFYFMQCGIQNNFKSKRIVLRPIKSSNIPSRKKHEFLAVSPKSSKKLFLYMTYFHFCM